MTQILTIYTSHKPCFFVIWLGPVAHITHLGPVKLRMTLDSNFVDVWAYPICCTAGMQNDTLSRDAFQEEQNTTYHFAAWHNLDC